MIGFAVGVNMNNNYSNAGTATIISSLLGGALGAVMAWIGSWATYAIGEIAEDMKHVRSELAALQRRLDDQAEPAVPAPGAAASTKSAAPAVDTIPAGKKRCPHCSALNNVANTACFACNESFE